jgi:hypothetical protein
MNILRLIIPAFILSYSTVSFSQNNSKFNFESLPNEKCADARFEENYNKGLTHYNKAVELIRNGGNDLALSQLDTLQKNAINEFRLALPYFENAYKINSKDENTLLALSGIHFGLNEQEKYDKYKKELELVRKK